MARGIGYPVLNEYDRIAQRREHMMDALCAHYRAKSNWMNNGWDKRTHDALADRDAHHNAAEKLR